MAKPRLREHSETLAHVAATVAAGYVQRPTEAGVGPLDIARMSVTLAEAIIAEVSTRDEFKGAPIGCTCKIARTAIGDMVTELCTVCAKERGHRP